jgi:hypothetical protein
MEYWATRLQGFMVAGVQGDRFEMQMGVKARQNVSVFHVYIDTGLHLHEMASVLHVQITGWARV